MEVYCDHILLALEHVKLEFAKELAQDISEEIKKGNKLMRVADSSDAGFETLRQH